MAILQLTEYALSLLMKISLTVNATIKLLYKSWNKFFNSRIYDRKSLSLFRMESKSGSSRHKLQNKIQWKVWVAVFLIAQ